MEPIFAQISPELLRNAAIGLLILLAGLCVREWARAWVAEKLGDPTPRAAGRVTLNPAAHFDWLGTLIFPLILIFFLGSRLPFGWAKHAQIDSSNFRHPARDSMIAALAGPFANLVIALLMALVGSRLFAMNPRTLDITGAVVVINVVLAVFNLLPIPPLDGSQVLRYLTNMSEETYIRLSMWGGFILLAIFLLPPLQRILHTLISIALFPFALLFPEVVLYI